MITGLNAAVGAAFIAAFAAILSAIISAVFGVLASKRNASQKIAQMRQIWIEDLRNHLANFVGLVHRILNESSSQRTRDDKIARLEEMNADLMRLESYISMKLNHEEEPHSLLVNVIGQTRGGAAIFSHSTQSEMLARIQRHLNEIDELSRFIFKLEWNKASDEIKPVSRMRRKQRELPLKQRYAAIEDTVKPYLNPLI